ncbi:signal peptidase I [candidate division WWE3 bacterium]|uniref:Signal peptidase I n=1 Tax=candidate division WWE3 bacterium TaxID=2053526 RepID=A0A7X9HH06_UNCKA|nr:signal peptidase I [candidate division WWE3 bacterium]
MKIKIGKINFNTIQNIIYVVFLIALFLLSTLFILSRFKTPLNIMAFNVQSGSMEPKIRVGSIVFIRPTDQYKVGDIITFRSRESIKNTFTHRITRIEQDPDINKLVYYTKGDSNPNEDIAPVDRAMVLGKVFLNLPLLGYPLAFAQTQLGFILLIIIPATLIIYSEILNIKSEIVKALAVKNAKPVKAVSTIVSKVTVTETPVKTTKPKRRSSVAK